jgi:hypothetical protein
MAVTWAIPWAVCGTAYSLLLLRSGPGSLVVSPPELFRMLAIILLAWGIVGAAQGLLFGLILSTLGRHWPRLTGPRVALLGAIAGSTPPLVLITLLFARVGHAPSGAIAIVPLAIIALLGALGALLGVATFAAAKHEALES